MRRDVRKLGIISDTHGLLRPEVKPELEGSDLIIHAGDIGRSEILDALRAIAPVIAVRGNIDKGDWANALPETALVEAGPIGIYVIHNLEELDPGAITAGVQIVVSGHSHKPSHTEHSGVHYVNPGSAGPRRFRLPIKLARMDLSRAAFEFTLVDLAEDG